MKLSDNEINVRRGRDPGVVRAGKFWLSRRRLNHKLRARMLSRLRQKYFTDVVLVNQNGEKMRFYSDLLQGKVVIINSFFATCTGSCLPLTSQPRKASSSARRANGKGSLHHLHQCRSGH